MRGCKLAIGIAAGLAAMCGTGLAVAAPCYIIIDRNDVIVYRDIESPIDLSPTGAADRAALRQRGHHLLVAEFENCYPVGYVVPVTGFSTTSVDDIVTQLRPAMSPGLGSGGGTANAGAPGSGSAAAGAPAGAGSTSLRSSVGGKVGAATGKRGY